MALFTKYFPTKVFKIVLALEFYTCARCMLLTDAFNTEYDFEDGRGS